MKTRKLLYSLAFLFVFSDIALKAQKSGDTDYVALSKIFNSIVQEWTAAYNSTDARNLTPLYATDAIYSSSHVDGLEAAGRDKIIAYFQAGMSGGGHIDNIEILKMNISCDHASLYCRYQATNSGVTVSGRNLLVLKRIKGKWLILNHMTVV